MDLCLRILLLLYEFFIEDYHLVKLMKQRKKKLWYHKMSENSNVYTLVRMSPKS